MDQRPATTLARRSPGRSLTILIGLCLLLVCCGVLFHSAKDEDSSASYLEREDREYGSLDCDLLGPPKSIAIVGAGAGGSSTAYHLRRFTQHCPGIEITVLERSSYVGGRSTTVNAHNLPSEPVELGASIFVNVNHILVAAVERFGLRTQGGFDAKASEDDRDDLGVWDGGQWVYYQDSRWPWWKIASNLVWKYQFAPFQTRSLMRNTVAKFLKMYEAPHFPFRDLSEKAFELGLTEATAVTGAQFLSMNKVGMSFGHDLVQASTRVNYATNLDKIHGLETMVCMATDGAMSVDGGNRKIFASMIDSSGADLRLNTSVTSLHLGADGKYDLTLTSATEESSTSRFDTVVLAAPYQFAELSIVPEPALLPPEIPYVNLHVLLFTSPFPLSATYFNLPEGDEVPSVILTTTPSAKHERQRNGAMKSTIGTLPPFNSISRLRVVTNPRNGQLENLYKIFSLAPLDREALHQLLKIPVEFEKPLADREIVTWRYDKLWQAYPEELPRVTFDNLFISMSKKDGHEQTSSRRHPGIWYTSSIEPFISTMETSALMGRNVARLIVDGWAAQTEATRSPHADIPKTGIQDIPSDEL